LLSLMSDQLSGRPPENPGGKPTNIVPVNPENEIATLDLQNEPRVEEPSSAISLKTAFNWFNSNISSPPANMAEPTGARIEPQNDAELPSGTPSLISFDAYYPPCSFPPPVSQRARIRTSPLSSANIPQQSSNSQSKSTKKIPEKTEETESESDIEVVKPQKRPKKRKIHDLTSSPVRKKRKKIRDVNKNMKAAKIIDISNDSEEEELSSMIPKLKLSLPDLAKRINSKRLKILKEENSNLKTRLACPICLLTLEPPMKCLTCGHIFHSRCMDECKRKGVKKCPTCRKKINYRCTRTIFI